MPKNPVPVESIPEVKSYEEAKEMLETFMEQHSRVFATFRNLADTLNQRKDAADKVVRAKQVSCGDWDLYQFQTKVDAEAMFNALGMDSFLKFGGTVSTKTVYEADKTKVEAAISRREISEELAPTILTKSPRYHSPKGE
jgi:hypothetical protein